MLYCSACKFHAALFLLQAVEEVPDLRRLGPSCVGVCLTHLSCSVRYSSVGVYRTWYVVFAFVPALAPVSFFIAVLAHCVFVSVVLMLCLTVGL